MRVLRSTAQYALSLGGADRCWRSGALILYRLGEALTRAGMGPLPFAGRVVRARTLSFNPPSLLLLRTLHYVRDILVLHVFTAENFDGNPAVLRQCLCGCCISLSFLLLESLHGPSRTFRHDF